MPTQVPRAWAFFMKIITYNGQQYTALTFFVLSKGNNAGRPSLKPNTNSFMITCSDDLEFKFGFAIATALHHSKTLKPFLRGSVIPFITIYDFKKVFNFHCASKLSSIDTTLKISSLIINGNKLISNLEQQLAGCKRLITANCQNFLK